MKNGADPKNARLTTSPVTAARLVANKRVERELAQDDLKPEEQPGDRGVERRRDPARCAAGDDDPQPVLRHPHHLSEVEASADPTCTIGPSRPTEPPVPMQTAEASALTIVTGGRIRPPFSATASITSGTPWPRASRANRSISGP